MQRYDTYKPSGIYFLPDLPKHWKTRKAKYLFKEENRPVRPDDEIVTCFRDGQVTLRKNRRTEGFTNSLKEIGYQGVRKGDLVIHNMDAFAGAIGISDSDGKATPVYACCTPKTLEVNQYYYCYLLRYLARNGFILSLAKGIRERSTDFRFNDFKELYLPIPSREEQDAIVKHIDTVTAKIDAAIAQQQKMIDLLNERKQIIINRAVTRGLNPNAKMKDSGVEWIGEVPEGWKILALKYIIRPKKKLVGRNSKNYDLLSLSLKGIIKRDMDNPDGKWPASFDTYQEVLPGDFVFCNFDNEETPRAVGLSSYKGMITGAYDVMYCFNKNVDTQYLLYYLLYIDNGKRFKPLYKGLRKTVPIDSLMGFKIPIPPMKEQVELVNRLVSQTRKIDGIIQSVSNQISLLQERKQIIINEVVTGKVKVG